MHFKTLFSMVLFFYVLATPITSSMQRSDDPTVLADVIEFAKNMPYATGALLCKEGGLNTVVFLNETTALTSAHHFKGRERAAHIVVACDAIDLWFHEKIYSWDLTLENIKKSGAHWVSVKKQYSMPKITESTLNAEPLANFTPHYFATLYQSWQNEKPKSVCKGVVLNHLSEQQAYDIDGADIAVLKFTKPITLLKKTIILQPISKDILTSYKAYSFGFPYKECLNNGSVYNKIFNQGEKKKGVCLPLMCLLAHNLIQSDDAQYGFSKLYSIGGEDEQFISEQLPSIDENRFIGLMMAGMSGGPLLFQVSAEEYILGGINMQTNCPNMKNQINDVIEALNEHYIKPNTEHDACTEEHNAKVIQWQKAIQQFAEKPWPIYNVFQLITPNVVKFIEKIMAL
jgi:hypothetical protein